MHIHWQENSLWSRFIQKWTWNMQGLILTCIILQSATLTPSWILGYEWWEWEVRERDLDLLEVFPKVPGAPQTICSNLTLCLLGFLPPSFRQNYQRRFQLSESDVEVNENYQSSLLKQEQHRMNPKLPDQSSSMGPCAPAFQITDRTGGWSVPTLEGAYIMLHYVLFPPSPLPVSCQCRAVAFIGISHGDLSDMWGKARQKLGDKCWLSGWDFPTPWSRKNLGRTRWVSNSWGLLKKTQLPQSYHPSAIGVFNPIFSSSVARYLITFQSQSEEMMNGGLCREAFWAWQSLSGGWRKRLVVWCLCHEVERIWSQWVLSVGRCI